MKKNEAAILAIGTELTDGQTLNRNAQWISERLTELKFKVKAHETVPDDRRMIRESLERLSAQRGLIFVTGGLGPTSDDFTREVVSEWADKRLTWNESAWEKIVDRLNRLGVVIAESNRQQCYFPDGAKPLSNSEGTAAGFSLRLAHCDAYVLPGPPRELEAIWDAHIQPELERRSQTGTGRRLFLFKCIGKSESALGEIVEAALQGGGFDIGYRAHLPYVEVKVWCEESEVEEKSAWLSRLEAKLQPWLVAKDDEDLANLFLSRLSKSGAKILDLATEGYLAQRLGSTSSLVPIEVTSRLPAVRERPDAVLDAELKDASGDLFVVAGPSSDGNWCLGMHLSGKVFRETLKMPFNPALLKDRSRRLIGELVLYRWRLLLERNR